MKNYCIDSDISIYFLKGNKKAVNFISQISNQNLFTTRINYTELLYGVYNSIKIKENLQKITSFLDNFHILEFNKNASEIFVTKKQSLKNMTY